MTQPDVPNRHSWLPSALPVLFGAEPRSLDPWPRLLELVTAFKSNVEDIGQSAALEAKTLAEMGGDLLPQRLRSDHPLTNDADRQSPMRVVLMGRTMAGKSSILAALSGSHHERIGDGRQRFSRDVVWAPTTISTDIEVVDTPGVGAYGGADDTEVAIKAALAADVILWVNSSDSIQQESAASLKLLVVIGKPIIVALNCRQSLEGVGRLNLMRFPDRVFGNKDGLIDEIRRHLAEAGVNPIAIVYVHALAAAEALSHDELDKELHDASRITDLTDALLREHDTHREGRRAVRLVDHERQKAQELSWSLREGARIVHARSERDRAMTRDLHQRLQREVRTTFEAMESDVQVAVGRRRDWHLNVTEFGDSLHSDWAREMTELQNELVRRLNRRTDALAEEIKATIEDTQTEWSIVSLDQFKLKDLSGFDSVWGNRIIRAGVGVGGSALGLAGGAWLGAQIGGALGLAGGPAAAVTAVVGFVVGGVAGLAAGRIKNLVDHVVLGKAGVLRKRRDEIAKQVGPLLDDLAREYQTALSTRRESLGEALSHERANSEGQAAAMDHVASAWTRALERLHSVVGGLDRETTSALLRLDGRERLARSLTRATRVPGVCILAEFEDSGFWEAWLFPPDLCETLAAGKVPPSGGEAASALNYILGLTDAPARLVRVDHASAVLIVDAEVPASIAQVWSGGLSAHTDRQIEIATTRRT